MQRVIATVVLLFASNTFMTVAWYYHVKQATLNAGKAWPLWTAIGISWLIALPEYLLQVPANRMGHVDHGGPFTLSQLKIIQEAITLVVFLIFTVWVAKEKPRATDYAAMGLVMAGVVVAMLGRNGGVRP